MESELECQLFVSSYSNAVAVNNFKNTRTWNIGNEAPESASDVTNLNSAKYELSIFTCSIKAVLTPSTIVKVKINIREQHANC